MPGDGVAIDEGVRAACIAHVGRSRSAEDAMSPAGARRLQAILDLAVDLREGDALPPTFHWAYLPDEVPQADIGADGHERLGLFLPPAPFHRRMWAASEVACPAPLILGRPARRDSTILSVEFKAGRSGSLCFVRIRHAISQGGGPCVDEVQTVVYRDRGAVGPALRGPGDPVPEGFLVHDDVQVVRYSAAIHNAHRIHWDRDHCRDVEGYADLVVQGPLLATRLAEAMRGRREGRPVRFAFRGLAPVLATTPVRLEVAKDGATARIVRSDGREATVAEMAWA